MTFKLSPDIGNNFCYAPWTNIHIDTRGNYKTCCAGTDSLGNLKDNSFDTDLLLDIKSKLVNNEYHTNCRLCKNNLVAERNWYTDIANNKIIPIDDITDSHLQNLDIRWSNTCNLSCVYCDSMFSSQWAQLRKEPAERTDFGNNLSNIIKHVTDNQATIKNIALLGGEPLLQKENIQLLDIVSNDVHVNIITNLSVPLANNKIFKRLLDMQNVMWDISFETVDLRFEYVRQGASWSTMILNLRMLQDAIADRPGHRVGITGQYSVYNCLDLVDLYRHFDLYALPTLRLNELQYPHELSVFSLPTDLMRQAAEQAILATEYTKRTHQHDQTELLLNIADRLNTSNNDHADIEKLYEWHAYQEEKYWPNSTLTFESLWPKFRKNTLP